MHVIMTAIVKNILETERMILLLLLKSYWYEINIKSIIVTKSENEYIINATLIFLLLSNLFIILIIILKTKNNIDLLKTISKTYVKVSSMNALVLSPDNAVKILITLISEIPTKQVNNIE